MLTPEYREILQKMAEHALAFIFDHCDDDQYCAVTSILVTGMREICGREKQFQRDLGVGISTNGGAIREIAQQPGNMPQSSRLNERLRHITGIGANRGE